MIMGGLLGRTAPPLPKMPPPVPPPAEVDDPEIEEAKLDMEKPKEVSGRDRKYRKKAPGKGKSKPHSKYKGGGIGGYTQEKAGNK